MRESIVLSETKSLMEGIKIIFQNPNFIKMCLALTVLYFVITGIQFWMSDYFITELKVKKETIFFAFGIVSITGPVLGVIVGGKIVSCLGGYNSRKSLYLIIVMAIFACLCAMPISYIREHENYL